ncbi:alpha/beta hydrolase [Salinimicrobium marinum]|uniref:Alpha/beta hydrolase n=1 Tax=Salinimicrobium marinum TaxID=680283 RepID=A0A918S9B5_9FLAO|nr:alpha/beta hydrolase [Salinimicrobium marinum]GHA28121.1 alpha/beta hydrolase [Salinimicrobium marinum]
MKKIIYLFLFLPYIFLGQEGNLKELEVDLENYEYPYDVHTLELIVQQQKLGFSYMDIKPEQHNGKNVLLLHGKNFNGAYWETTIEKLSKTGFRVIVPDQVGFGKSSKPEYFQYSFHQLALNTKNLLDTLGVEKVAVLGHSMGGMLATRFALMFPEVTEKLILENPIGLEDYKRVIPYKPVSWWYENELDKDYQQIKNYQKENYYDGQWKPEYDEWVNILAGWTLNENYPLVAWNAALTYDMIFTQPVVHEFHDIEVPTLLIIGTRDRTALGKPLVSEEERETMGKYQELGKNTQDKIPNSELVELEGIGHLPHIEAFDRFIEPLLAFLKE